MKLSPLILELINAFKVLPGVGPKSAQRMAFHLLERNRSGALQLNYVRFALILRAVKQGLCVLLNHHKTWWQLSKLLSLKACTLC